jgi:hypothetical protein
LSAFLFLMRLEVLAAFFERDFVSLIFVDAGCAGLASVLYFITPGVADNERLRMQARREAQAR